MMGRVERQETRGESGFALILALLTLLLLTFLGLTLAATTSTEMKIATNYRWAQQAYYNAESGVEIAKRLLREQTVWSIFIPPARSAAQMSTLPTWTATGRDFENKDCDVAAYVGGSAGYQGYGVVMNLVGYPRFENAATFFGQTINGSFTVWVRRPLQINADGTTQDYPQDDKLTITTEGTAPFQAAAAGSNYAVQNRAVRVFEIDIKKVNPNDCENLSGQTGGGPSGAGYDPCSQINAKGLPGTATEVNPNQN
jgi:type IV pilus assembly PilX-like protein